MLQKTLLRIESKNGRSRNNDERLLDALEAMLLEGKSFEDMSAETISERAGLSKGTFYRRYENKTAICTHLYVTRIAPEWIQHHVQILSNERCADMSVRDILRTFLEGGAHCYQRFRVIAKLVGKQLRYENPSDDIIEANKEVGSRLKDLLLARLFEHIDDILHPQPEVAIGLAATLTANYVRDHIFYAQEGKVPSYLDDPNLQHLLDELADIFAKHIHVREFTECSNCGALVSGNVGVNTETEQQSHSMRSKT